jgi:hypothetical protein
MQHIEQGELNISFNVGLNPLNALFGLQQTKAKR